MTEEEARAWLLARPDVPRETYGLVEVLSQFVIAENEHQNLIAQSTVDHIMVRHIVDSAQLLDLCPDGARRWIDLGSGAGFPGLVVALLRPDLHVTLVESRRRRIEFLTATAARLGLSDRVQVAGVRIEMMESAPFDVISARAFAPLGKLLSLAHRFSTTKTRWLLPKGRNAGNELEEVQSSWQGSFRIVPSVTDPEAAILVAENVQPKGRRR
jgi:16S rRNA (guanine527-N7)-methyltransferase